MGLDNVYLQNEGVTYLFIPIFNAKYKSVIYLLANLLYDDDQVLKNEN